MELFEIYNLDCSKKQNRKLLLKRTMKVLKTDEKPDKEYLERICKSLSKKYNIKIQYIKNMEKFLYVSIYNKISGGYNVIKVNSYYELLLKFVLVVKFWKEKSKLKAK